MALFYARVLLVLGLVISLAASSQTGGNYGEVKQGHKKFLLIHGATSGAYIWYKVFVGLEEKGHQVAAVDMLALGRDTTPTCEVTSIGKWATNAVKYVQGLPPGEKVIVVVHSMSGLVGEYLSENFPEKIEAAVYLAALIPRNGEVPLPFVEAASRLPGVVSTRCDSTYSTMATIQSLCSDCSEEVVKLLELTARPQPTLFYGERVRITAARFGSVRRFWIKTTRDTSLPLQVQDSFIARIKPEAVYDVSGGHIALITVSDDVVRVLDGIAQKLG